MKNGLLEINEVNGVSGSILCSNDGVIFESAPPSDLNKETLANICAHVVDLLGVGQQSIAGVKEYVINYQEKKLFILDLEKVILVVISNSNVDVSLLRMGVNIVTMRWASDSTIQLGFKRYAKERVVSRKLSARK